MLALLKSVSRSFYLSIRLLPRPLREPVSLAYLLARASDTIADAPGLAARVRIEALDRFIRAVDGAGAPPTLALSAGMSPGEQRLLEALPRCIASLRTLSPEDREDVRTALGQITHGQRLDVERFGDASASNPRALANPDELDEYTYLVAGCVGEFWTKLGMRHLPAFATLPEEEMMDLARSYGMALQLINVLRDEQHDLGIGRRYLTPQQSREDLLDRAHAGLACGMRYAGALRSARVRVATALPALIGARTIALVREQGPGAKMPRREVRGLLMRVAIACGSNAVLQREFRRWDNRPQ
jgi:farnesyl-diphosphate farnesyltransferase